MIYNKIFAKYADKQEIIGAVIGAGHFGTAAVTQSLYTPRLSVRLVANRHAESAMQAILRAGIEKDFIVYASTAAQASDAIRAGKYVYSDNPLIVAEVPQIDVVAEGTGVPEAGARHCLDAILAGKHVTSINKELESAVGPILRKKAIDNGVSYSPADGDQPALLMGMIEWAKTIGLTVVSAGKARDIHFILDEERAVLVSKKDGGIYPLDEDTIAIPREYEKYFRMIPNSIGAAAEYIAARSECLHGIQMAGDYDLCELTVIANDTGLHPSVPETTAGLLRIPELPVAYCSKKNNGIYNDEGVVDLHTNLHRYDEGGMGGGVYMVVRCENSYSQFILTSMGQHINYDGSTAVLYRPYHLCGVEVSTSMLSQGLLGIDTGTFESLPRFDLAKKAARDIKKGEVFGDDHDEKMKAEIIPSRGYSESNPIPAHLATGNVAKRDICRGEWITYADVEEPANSPLWMLRREQDTYFGK